MMRTKVAKQVSDNDALSRKLISYCDFVDNVETRVIQPLKALADLLTFGGQIEDAIPTTYNIFKALGLLISATLDKFDELKSEFLSERKSE